MGLSKLAAKCQTCPFVSTCGHKRMEEVGYLIPSVPAEQQSVDISQGSTTIEQIALQNSIAVDEIVRMVQSPFEENIRTYLNLIERSIMTVSEVREIHHLK